ncbi:MAG: phosphate ABC transporter permease subunit PstC [Actinomycetes bacterium]
MAFDQVNVVDESEGERVRADLVRARSARSIAEGSIRVLLMAAAAISIATTTAIVVILVRESLSFFSQVPLAQYLFGTKWTPLLAGDQQSFGVLPLLWGTFYLTGIGLLLAIPCGLLSAIYLAEFARPKVRNTVKPILELLAGMPTIIFGYFALTFITPKILRGLFGVEVLQYNGLAAGLTLGLLVIPTIASVAEDAMRSVPHSLREGAFGLGASRLQVALRVVFPAALSGVVAALILGASRAVGETVIILIAGGQQPSLSLDPRISFQSMASFIAATARGDIPQGTLKYETIFVVGFTLFIVTLLLNAVSSRLVRRYRQVYE